MFSSKSFYASVVCLLLSVWSVPALASGPGPGIDWSLLQLWWAAPFACMLLSIAILPLVFSEFWSNHFGKISLGWALLFLLPFTLTYGINDSFATLEHTIIMDYVPFIILLFALFTISGGVRITGTLVGTPLTNTAILGVGTLLASLMGTTGASMLLIRPLLQANAHRRYKTHSIVFFIFLVANIGGSLTPLGDPPLFLGFLKGVSFFWTTTHIYKQMLFASFVLLGVYFLLDKHLLTKEGKTKPAGSEVRRPKSLGIEGKVNLLLLLGVIGAVLVSGIWNPEREYQVFEVHVQLQDLVRDVLLLALAGLSLLLTAKETRKRNDFSWEPIEEVAKLFFGIFVTMIPAIGMLKAGEHGAFSSIIGLVTNDGVPVNHMYFWLSGILSSFLDNAPTYLVFFNTAGGDAAHLMIEAPLTLAAISCGSVFMGANSYIGNAPNFMIRSIAEAQGVKMPSFFGYMVWSFGILIPLFLIMTFIFFI